MWRIGLGCAERMNIMAPMLITASLVVNLSLEFSSHWECFFKKNPPDGFVHMLYVAEVPLMRTLITR